jgi:hypothetical protein
LGKVDRKNEWDKWHKDAWRKMNVREEFGMIFCTGAQGRETLSG